MRAVAKGPGPGCRLGKFWPRASAPSLRLTGRKTPWKRSHHGRGVCVPMSSCSALERVTCFGVLSGQWPGSPRLVSEGGGTSETAQISGLGPSLSSPCPTLKLWTRAWYRACFWSSRTGQGPGQGIREEPFLPGAGVNYHPPTRGVLSGQLMASPREAPAAPGCWPGVWPLSG